MPRADDGGGRVKPLRPAVRATSPTSWGGWSGPTWTTDRGVLQNFPGLMRNPRPVGIDEPRRPPQQPEKRGIIGLSPDSAHPPPIDHRLHKVGFEPLIQRFECQSPIIRPPRPKAPGAGRRQDMIPSVCEALRARTVAQPIGARPRHPHAARRGRDRAGDIECAEKPALPRLAPPIGADAQRHRPEERRAAAMLVGESLGHRQYKPQTGACRKMVFAVVQNDRCGGRCRSPLAKNDVSNCAADAIQAPIPRYRGAPERRNNAHSVKW